jgi:hypothetical protein
MMGLNGQTFWTGLGSNGDEDFVTPSPYHDPVNNAMIVFLGPGPVDDT